MRRFVRWVPASVLTLLLFIGWALVFRGGLAGVGAWLALMTLGALLGVLVLVVVAVHGARRRRMSPPMIAAAVAGAFAAWPGAWSFGVLRIPYPATIARTEPHAHVRLPTDAPMVVAWGGDRLSANYHAFTADQRWAYDLVVEPAFHGGTELTAYGCWGVPVVAPASGIVRAAVDAHDDHVPGTPSGDARNPIGNHVAIELASGTFLILAHLKRGSVLVAAGDTVREGDVVGACGNSGNTSEPHVHIHHQRQDPSKFPVGFAEGLPLFFVGHGGPPMPEGGIDEAGGRVRALGPTIRHGGGT